MKQTHLAALPPTPQCLNTPGAGLRPPGLILRAAMGDKSTLHLKWKIQLSNIWYALRPYAIYAHLACDEQQHLLAGTLKRHSYMSKRLVTGHFVEKEELDKYFIRSKRILLSGHSKFMKRNMIQQLFMIVVSPESEPAAPLLCINISSCLAAAFYHLLA